MTAVAELDIESLLAGLHHRAKDLARLAAELGWTVQPLHNGGVSMTRTIDHKVKVHHVPPVRQWNQHKMETLRKSLFTYGDPQLVLAHEVRLAREAAQAAGVKPQPAPEVAPKPGPALAPVPRLLATSTVESFAPGVLANGGEAPTSVEILHADGKREWHCAAVECGWRFKPGTVEINPIASVGTHWAAKHLRTEPRVFDVDFRNAPPNEAEKRENARRREANRAARDAALAAGNPLPEELPMIGEPEPEPVEQVTPTPPMLVPVTESYLHSLNALSRYGEEVRERVMAEVSGEKAALQTEVDTLTELLAIAQAEAEQRESAYAEMATRYDALCEWRDKARTALL